MQGGLGEEALVEVGETGFGMRCDSGRGVGEAGAEAEQVGLAGAGAERGGLFGQGAQAEHGGAEFGREGGAFCGADLIELVEERGSERHDGGFEGGAASWDRGRCWAGRRR